MAVCITVPETVNNWQFTDVQRGVIFMYLLFSFFLFIIVGVRLVAGAIDPENEKYE